MTKKSKAVRKQERREGEPSSEVRHSQWMSSVDTRIRMLERRLAVVEEENIQHFAEHREQDSKNWLRRFFHG